MLNWIPELIDNLQEKSHTKRRKSIEAPLTVPNHSLWRKFPLGFDMEDREVFWDPYESKHFYTFGKHANMISANLVRHCAKNPDHWLTYVVDYNGVNVPRTEEFDSQEIEYLTTIEETYNTIQYLQEEMKLRISQLKSWNYSSILDQSVSYKSILTVITVPYWVFLPSGIKTDEGKKEDEMRVEINTMIDNILRNGPKAGVHLAIIDEHFSATRYIDKIKHISTKVIIGRSNPEIAVDVLGHDQGTQFDPSVRGRGYYQANDEGLVFDANQYSVYADKNLN